MSYGSNTKWEEESADVSDAQPLENASVMRNFLESGVEFKWPERFGGSSGNHCEIFEVIPFKWIKMISNKYTSIDMYKAGAEFGLQKPFVVKIIRDPDIEKARKLTAKEVENMKDLRHPHVAALLATFTFQARMHILIFPAACCDLDQFMQRMSKNCGDQGISGSDGTDTVHNDTTSSSQPQDSNVGSVSKHQENENPEGHSEPWPLKTIIDKQDEMLRSWFICLSQALSYLHRSGVRHKDIKPGNILIDESGSVILTDFGISRRFPKHAPHATNNERNFTPKYASPEIMNEENVLRDDSSDVFSLGCVFLEMITLLYGISLNNLSDHCTTLINETSKEQAYYCNLHKAYSWIATLTASRESKPVQMQENPPSPEDHMIVALANIRQMLDETPSNRPLSEGLWEKFQYISTVRCRDCDPRRSDIWEPSARQKQDAQTGLNNRRSLHAIEGRKSWKIEASVPGHMDSSMLSDHLTPETSTLRSCREPFPSTRQQKHSRHGHTRTKSESESPTLVNGNIREVIRPVEFSSPVPKTGAVPKEIKTEASAITPAANVIQDAGRQMSNRVPPTRSLQNSELQGTNLDLSHQRAIRQVQQARAPNQRRATGGDKSTSEPSGLQFYRQIYIEAPQTRIIAYDVLQTKAFETVFASVKDEEYRRCPLPQFRQRVKIGDRADLIGKVDLRRLKFKTKMRRWMGDFPFIYVLNHTAQPAQTQNRRNPGG